MKEIFREYGIRGVYPSEINESFFEKFGRAFVVWQKAKKVYVGRDDRVSSPALAKALMLGLREQGADVIDLGLISTPMAYLASRNGHVLMVTASHNPAKYNGIKVVLKGPRLVGGKTLEPVRKLLNRPFAKAKKGRHVKKTILSSYLSLILKHAQHVPKLNVVLDAGNGMAGLTIPKIVKELPLNVTYLDFEIDGRYPHHVPNPALPENVKDCAEMVKHKRANLGVSFDGDMDRAMFIDEHGRVIPADVILALFATHTLKQHPKRAVVYDLRASRAVKQAIQAHGGIPVESKVGHTNIVNKMKRFGAILGGELSGHYYFKEFFGVESADLAFIKVLNIMGKTGLPLSALVNPYLQYYHSGELNFSVADKTRTIAKIANEFKGKQSRLDGLTVQYPDAWFNIRLSNTEPLVRLVIEANTQERMHFLKEKLMKYLH